jgi:hypothetical protein
MKIYQAKDGSFHRDAKSAGLGATPFEFDNKTKDGVLSLLAAVGARGRPTSTLPEQSIPKPKDDAEGPSKRSADTWWRIFHSRAGQVGVFVAGCRAWTAQDAIDYVASELVAMESSR